MISKISLHNFKCFRQIDLPIAPLTLLSGLNSSGKSSVLHALLLLRQSNELGLLERGRLSLNGELAQLGAGVDALYDEAEEHNIAIGLEWEEGNRAEWRFQYDMRSDALAAESAPDKATYAQQHPFTKGFHYLTAERIGPRTAFSTSDHIVRLTDGLGIRGEYAAHYLSLNKNKPLACPLLMTAGVKAANLLRQTEAWLECVSPGARIEVEAHPTMDIVELSYHYPTSTGWSRKRRSTNVGFGLTYTLPVLVAILSAVPGSLVLVENPEAHLHPRGQMEMGRLIALAASAGVQLIIETHSDHILNGMRVAVLEKLIAPEKVCLHFFSRRVTNDGLPFHEVISPVIDKDGRIDKWPDGFFDEWERSLDRLLGDLS